MSRRTRILMAALALFVFLGAVMSGYLNSDATPRQKYQISVIVYGNNRDRWAFLREGLNQGASELPVELSFSAMAQEADPQEQIRVVNQEIRNGADGILLAACDSTALNQTVAEAAGQVPVLMLETDVEDNAKTLGCLAADDYEMGKALGEFVKETYPGKMCIRDRSSALACGSCTTTQDTANTCMPSAATRMQLRYPVST